MITPVKTVESHRAGVLKKMRARNAVHLSRMAHALRLSDLEEVDL